MVAEFELRNGMPSQGPTPPAAPATRGVLVWLAVLVLGLLHLPYPLGGDQALFLHYAQGMADGQALYVDLWDNKQPGIFWFYQAAGALLGHSAVGVHALELMWLLLTGWVLHRALASSGLTPSWRSGLPALCIGLLYWCARPSSMAQVEVLVALPLSLCLWAAQRLSTQAAGGWRWQLLGGAAAGVVGTFKLVLMPVPLALWMVAMCLRWRLASRPHGRALAGEVALALLGVVAIATAVAGHFVIKGQWEIFAWTQWAYPRQALLELPPKPLANLWAGASWWLLTFAPALPMLVLGWRATRRARAPWPQPHAPGLRPVVALALAWLGTGAAVIVMQKWSWWGYHFMLLVVPMGVLMACAMNALWATGAHAARLWGWACLLAVAVTGSPGMLRTVRATTAALAAPTGEGAAAYRAAVDPVSAVRWQQAAFLRQAPWRGGQAYVFGHPQWLLDGDQRQALPVHGWSWEVMLASQWAALPGELERRKPTHLYVDEAYAELMAQRSPALTDTIKRLYRALPPVAGEGIRPGQWHRLREPAAR